MALHAINDLRNSDDAAGFKGVRQIGDVILTFDVGECIGRNVRFALAGVDEDGAARLGRPNPLLAPVITTTLSLMFSIFESFLCFTC